MCHMKPCDLWFESNTSRIVSLEEVDERMDVYDRISRNRPLTPRETDRLVELAKQRSIIMASRKYRAAHREERNEARRKYAKDNPEKNREAARKWRMNNADRSRQSRKDWLAANPEKRIAYNEQARASRAAKKLAKKLLSEASQHIDRQIDITPDGFNVVPEEAIPVLLHVGVHLVLDTVEPEEQFA